MLTKCDIEGGQKFRFLSEKFFYRCPQNAEEAFQELGTKNEALI